LSVSENDLDNTFIAFPNPTNGNLKIDFGKTLNNVTVSVIDILGSVINVNTYQNKESINVTIDGVSGVYFLQINTENDKKKLLRVVKK
ncbi:MAG: T9SS type A sorting domain-containing protein, partial [Flavobacteriaceae bacterium]|nr:T9SS type A sorting domain-containing protein [Flavobacteriaceae bacterium]